MPDLKTRHPAGGRGVGGPWELAKLEKQQRKISTSSAVDTLLARLDRVREAGPGRWIACCPAHDDRRPSLSIREASDGTLLLHDFAGCSAADIVAAVGLELADLFPNRLADCIPSQRDRKHIHAAREALKALKFEVLLVAVAAENVHRGIELDDADRARLWEAAHKIRAAAEVCV